MGAIRVLIVDDSLFMRKMIGDILQADPNIEVIGEAANGAEALREIEKLHPTVVTLDIEMPEMDGLVALQAIMGQPTHPPVVMVSGYVPEGTDIVLECLRLGAADFVPKPSGSFSIDMDKVATILRQKVVAAAGIDIPQVALPEPAPAQVAHYDKAGGVVIIGASTGGPAALEVILPSLPSTFPYPVVVAQHLPKEFTELFKNRLQKTCQLPVIVAQDAMKLSAGTIYIVAGDTTTTVTAQAGRPVFKVTANTVDIQTPSIDEVMITGAGIYGSKTIGVILTGMGADGSEGMACIKKNGGTTIAQDKASSIVYGMNKEVAVRGLADHIVPLQDVVPTLSGLLR
jgi:two-component system chemotaxis response regulator CheB